jgi:hypothetical protein
MLKTLCLCALVGMMLAVTVKAGDSPCSGSAPIAVKQPAAPAPVAQAQRPQAVRSFSYQPSNRPLTNYNLNTYIGIDSGRRWEPAFRPAAAKARGNY